MTSTSQSLGDKVLRSAFFSVAANMVRQSIGIVSTLVLARLLTPEDYGIVAAAMMVIYFFDVFSQTGINQYILSRDTLEVEELHTAWTLRILLRTILTVIVVLTAPWLADYFNQDNLRAVLYAVAVIPIIDALQSPGLLLLRRSLEYRTISFLTVIAKMFSFVTGLTVAILYQSYWALVVGNIVLVTVFTMFSYRLHTLRPRLSLRGVGKQLSFAKWIMVRSIAGYSRAKIDNFLIGRHLGIVDLGVYSLAKQLATMPHEHATRALTDIFLSSIGGSSGRKAGAASTTSKILVAVISLMLPVVIGMFYLADKIVLVLLGSSWINAVPAMQALSLLSLTFSICVVINASLVALERVRRAFVLDFATSIVLIASMAFVLTQTTDLAYIAWIRSGVGLVIAAMFYLSVCGVMKMPHRSLCISLIPSVVTTSAMAVLIIVLKPLFQQSLPIYGLVAITLAGCGLYTSVFYLLVKRMNNVTDELKFVDTLLVRGVTFIKSKMLSIRSNYEVK